MFSNPFRDKICVYCGAVINRRPCLREEILFANDPRDLPQMPACLTCNNKKSDLETYATVMLTLACHPSSLHMEAYIEQAQRRLTKNVRLQRQLERESTAAWARHNDIIRKAVVPPLDVDKIKDLVRHIGIELAFHYREILLDGRVVIEAIPAPWRSANFVRMNGASNKATGPSGIWGTAQPSTSPVRCWTSTNHDGRQLLRGCEIHPERRPSENPVLGMDRHHRFLHSDVAIAA